jgi:hypothetical protein
LFGSVSSNTSATSKAGESGAVFELMAVCTARTLSVARARWNPGARPDFRKILRTGDVNPRPSGVMTNCRFLGDTSALASSMSSTDDEARDVDDSQALA